MRFTSVQPDLNLWRLVARYLRMFSNITLGLLATAMSSRGFRILNLQKVYQDPDILQGLILGGLCTDPKQQDIICQSSQVIAIRPCEDRHSCITSHKIHLWPHIQGSPGQKRREILGVFNIFWNVRQSRSVAGWMWEHHVLQLLGREAGVLLFSRLSMSTIMGSPRRWRYHSNTRCIFGIQAS